MKVYCIRHGQSIANLENKVAGWTACPLSDLGHEQAKALEPVMSKIKFDKIYSSDLFRAIQTAKHVIPGCEPEQSPLAREISLGSLCGTAKDELIARYGELYLNAMKDRDFVVFGGETAEMVYDRVAQFMKELEKLEGVENVAVFAHMGTVHAMVEYVLGFIFPLRKLSVNNCSVTEFLYENGTWKLVCFDYTPELT